MPKKKTDAEKKDVVANYTIEPWFAMSCDLPALSGIRGVGKTPFKALINLRSEVRRHYSKDYYNLEEHITNPEFVEGWRMPEPS